MTNAADQGKSNKLSYISVVVMVLVLSVLAYQLLTKEKNVVIGIAGWNNNSQFNENIAGFKEGLADNGYVENKNTRFIIKYSETKAEQQRLDIQAFVDDKVDLIYTITTPGTLVAKEITEKIDPPTPVVFSVCTYPVESKLIASLDASENNLVGTRNYVPFSQQFFIFEQIVPGIKKIGVVHRQKEINSSVQVEEIKKLLTERGIELVVIAAVDLNDIRQQLEKNMESFDAIFSTCDTLTHNGGDEIIAELGIKYKKPTFACNKVGVLKGILVGNVADFKAIGRISGEKAALILNGSKPTWLKTESPRENYVVVNQNTARKLGINIPPSILNSAKEIVAQ